MFRKMHDNKKVIEEILEGWDVPSTKSTDEAWGELQSKLKQTDETPVVEVRKRRPWFAAAAAAAVLLAISWFSFSSDAGRNDTELQSFSEYVDHELPDGSMIKLNAGSVLAYNKADWDEKRNLYLEGEAFFDVAKGEKFTVETEGGKVQVHGTEFNVYFRKGELEVRCYEGRVEVIDAQRKSSYLDQGQIWNTKEGVAAFDHEQSNWTSGVFNWNAAPIEKVFDEVERQYGISLELDQNIEGEYTGSFEKLEVQEVLSLICEPMGLTFEESDLGKYSISQIKSVNNV